MINLVCETFGIKKPYFQNRGDDGGQAVIYSAIIFGAPLGIPLSAVGAGVGTAVGLVRAVVNK